MIFSKAGDEEESLVSRNDTSRAIETDAKYCDNDVVQVGLWNNLEK